MRRDHRRLALVADRSKSAGALPPGGGNTPRRCANRTGGDRS
jgi:hypothetical protein